jgi:hypothetical protein
MTPSLEQVLADWSERAQVLRACGHPAQADTLTAFGDEVRAAQEDWLTWLWEDDAVLKSGRGRDWFRSRFAEWAARDLARKEGRRRRYRSVIVPQRVNLEAAREQGRRDGEAAA